MHYCCGQFVAARAENIEELGFCPDFLTKNECIMVRILIV
jgi:hypothetical protein